MVWPTLHFPIFLADCDQRKIQFDSFCQSKKSIKFSFRLITFYYLKTFKNFQSWTIGFDPYCAFKKNYQTALELCCTSQNFYPETIRFKSYSPLKYFIQVSTKSSILFSIFIKSCIFFPLFTPFLKKLNQGQYWLTHIFLFKKMINFCQKHIWFELRCILISFSMVHFSTLKYYWQMTIADSTG